MREMKDTGIEWIGEIPKNWNIVRNKYLFRYIKGQNPTSLNSEGNGLPYIGASDIESSGISYKYSNFSTDDINRCSKQDPLVLWDGARAGAIGIGHEGLISSTIVAVRPYDAKVHKKYLYWYLKAFQPRLLEMVGGTTIPHMSRDYIERVYFLDVSSEEQQKIASYLDQKVSVIDNIIEKTRESIEEYKKLKQSIIAEAVTKGLNPDVKMKKSGFEWIGEIPEHWDKIYLTQILQQVKNKNLGMKETNLLSLSYGKIIRKDINTANGLLPENFEGYNIITKDDIVLRLTDLQNDQKSLRVGLVEENGIITSAYITLRAKTLLCSQFIYYFLHSFDVCKGFYGMGSGVRQGLTFEGIKYLNLYLPTFDEQVEIVNYIKSKTDKIEKFIDKKEQLINELESYKKSLIYEVVTGKKEIPTQEVGTLGL